jgi:hypothetical protein
MIWLTWRQFRIPAIVAAGALTVVAVVLGVTGPHLFHLYDSSGIATCHGLSKCQDLINAFQSHYQQLRLIGTVLVVVPGVIGMFWGAPLIARELETGMHRLAWTQSVTRTRWLLVKLAIVGLASMAAAGLFSLMVTWWSGPFDRVAMDRFGIGMFGERGLVPVGYAAFAFALGVAAGLLIRRTLPAMATTLFGFLVVRMAVSFWVRPNLIPPVVKNYALTLTTVGFGSTGPGPATLLPNVPPLPNAWIYSTRIVDAGGHPLAAQLVAKTCPTVGQSSSGQGGHPPGSNLISKRVPAGAQHVLSNCIAKIGLTYHEVVTYQPASRYWPMQWSELAMFLGLALALAGFCFWWVRRGLS